MCELFAFSSSDPTRANFVLDEFKSHGCAKGPHCDGWGLAFYQEQYAQVFREEKPAAFSEWMEFLLSHENYSQCVISHIRKATQGDVALKNTQPFSRENHGRRHIFAHNGDLGDFKQDCQFVHYHPIGDTDSEYAFCTLMDAVSILWLESTPTLKQRIDLLTPMFSQWSTLGPANFIYSEYLYTFANKRHQANGKIIAPGLHYLQRSNKKHQCFNRLAGVELMGDVKEITLFASVPLSSENWQPFKENELIICQNGKIIEQIQL